MSIKYEGLPQVRKILPEELEDYVSKAVIGDVFFTRTDIGHCYCYCTEEIINGSERPCWLEITDWRKQYMNDFELTINNIEYYRNKICEEVNHECGECEAGYQDCRCKEQCSFDDVIRLIRVKNGVY